MDRSSDRRAGMTGCASSTCCWPPAPASAKCWRWSGRTCPDSRAGPGVHRPPARQEVPQGGRTKGRRRPVHRHDPGVRRGGTAGTTGIGNPLRPGVPDPPRHASVRGQRRTHWRAIRGENFQWVVPHSIRKSVVTAVQRSMGLEAAGPTSRAQQQRDHVSALRGAVRDGVRLQRRPGRVFAPHPRPTRLSNRNRRGDIPYPTCTFGAA